MRILLVGLAGAAGALSRYGIGVAVETDLFLRTDRAATAVAYVLVSVGLGVAAAASGYRVGVAVR